MTRPLTESHVAMYRKAAGAGADYIEVWAPDLRAFLDAYDAANQAEVPNKSAEKGPTPAIEAAEQIGSRW